MADKQHSSLTDADGLHELKGVSAGTYKLARWMGVYVGDSNTLDNPARVIARADSTGVTVKVNGWYVRALHTN
jgi:hypothetical protein